MEEQIEKIRLSKKKRLRRFGLIVGVFGGVLGTSIIWAFGEFGTYAVLIAIAVFSGIITLAWKKPLIGGISLIVVGIPLIIPFGIPLLASGVLFLLSRDEEERYVSNGKGTLWRHTIIGAVLGVIPGGVMILLTIPVSGEVELTLGAGGVLLSLIGGVIGAVVGARKR